jgi:chromosomal replication initiation ATPase DnaA
MTEALEGSTHLLKIKEYIDIMGEEKIAWVLNNCFRDFNDSSTFENKITVIETLVENYYSLNKSDILKYSNSKYKNIFGVLVYLLYNLIHNYSYRDIAILYNKSHQTIANKIYWVLRLDYKNENEIPFIKTIKLIKSSAQNIFNNQ